MLYEIFLISKEWYDFWLWRKARISAESLDVAIRNAVVAIRRRLFLETFHPEEQSSDQSPTNLKIGYRLPIFCTWTQSSDYDHRPSLCHGKDQLIHAPTAIHTTERTRWESFVTTTGQRQPNTFKLSPAVVLLLLIRPFLLSLILIETRDQAHFRPRPPP